MEPGKISQLLYRSTGVLLLHNPLSTSLGLLLGSAIHTVVKILSPLFGHLRFVDIGAVQLWEFMVGGVLIVHLPAVGRLFKRNNEFGERTENALAMIKEAERGGVSQVAIRSMYIQLCQAAIDNATLGRAAQSDLTRLGIPQRSNREKKSKRGRKGVESEA